MLRGTDKAGWSLTGGAWGGLAHAKRSARKLTLHTDLSTCGWWSGFDRVGQITGSKQKQDDGGQHRYPPLWREDAQCWGGFPYSPPFGP